MITLEKIDTAIQNLFHDKEVMKNIIQKDAAYDYNRVQWMQIIIRTLWMNNINYMHNEHTKVIHESMHLYETTGSIIGGCDV